MSDNLVAGTGEDGVDVAPNDPVSRFMEDLRQRQEALWAIVSHGAVRIDGQVWDTSYGGGFQEYLKWAESCTVYLPKTLDGLDVKAWADENWPEVWAALKASLRQVVQTGPNDADCTLCAEWVLPVPAELATFVNWNTGRPMPRRYNSTVVQYTERDGITWLTHPELKLYDALRESGWTFIPQPAFVIGPRTEGFPTSWCFGRAVQRWRSWWRSTLTCGTSHPPLAGMSGDHSGPRRGTSRSCASRPRSVRTRCR